jgi:hypothetical protein
MKRRFQPWHLAALVLILCTGAVWLAHRWRASRRMDATALVECLPRDRSTHVYIDVDALRRGGLLDLVAGSSAAEEPDYRRFVDQTGFDYRTDLDAVAAGFTGGDVYLALRGRFDWKHLAKYARDQRGKCVNVTCDMPASTPDRHISFYPLESNVLALAVTRLDRDVTMIGPSQWPHPPQLPPEPVWISAPSFAFTDVNNLPAGTHAFLSPLAQAQNIVFAIGPDGNRLQIRLDVACANPESAAALAAQLTSTTAYLKKMLERDHKTPNAGDLSGVLVAGAFQQKDQRVVGTWPVERAFVEALATGKTQ